MVTFEKFECDIRAPLTVQAERNISIQKKQQKQCSLLCLFYYVSTLTPHGSLAISAVDVAKPYSIHTSGLDPVF